MSASAKKPEPERGFALIIALALMAFIVVTLITLSTVLRVEIQASGFALDRLEAKSNAQLGARVALGELQRQLGQDARATAQAGLVTNNPADGRAQWTGVWNTDGGDLLRWMVSGDDPDPDGGGGPTATLLAPDTGSPADEVVAPTVSVDGGEYAYWAEGQGVKASIFAAPEENRVNDGPPVLQAMAPGMQGFEFILGSGEPSRFSPIFDGSQRERGSMAYQTIQRASASDSLEALPGASALEPRLFGELTASSFGVLASTHPDFAGLKHDLSLQPDTGTGGPLSLGPGYVAFANAVEAVIPPSASPIVNEEQDLRRVYEMRAPVPAVSEFAGARPQDSIRKGTPVFAIHPILTQFSFRIWPHVTAVDPISPFNFGDRELALQVVPSARFWNPYTSAIEMEDTKLQLEVSGFPEMTIRFLDLHDDPNILETVTAFDPEVEFSSPLVFEYELDNNRRAAPGNQPGQTFIDPDEAYDEILLGPGRVMSFTRRNFDSGREVFQHSANHEWWNDNSNPNFGGAQEILVKMPGIAPPFTSEQPVPPIQFTRGRGSNNHNPGLTPIQEKIFENLRIVFDIPAFEATFDLFVVRPNGNRERLQTFSVSFPSPSTFERRIYETLPNGRIVGHEYGIPGGRFYVLGPTETALAYSFRLREATPGLAAYPQEEHWLRNDVRWSVHNSAASLSQSRLEDAYAPTYRDMAIWDSNFDSIWSWHMNHVNRRSEEDQIYASLINRFYGVVDHATQLNTIYEQFVNTERDVYLFELPRRDLLSLGALQHLQVHGYPPFAIGNSWGRDPAAGGGAVLAEDLNLIYDRYFLSGLVPGRSEPRFGAGADRPLPHPNLVFRNPAPALFPEDGGPETDAVLVDSAADSSAFLMTQGAFNVNTTSVDAWIAALASQRLLDFRYMAADSNLWDDNHIAAVDFVETDDEHVYATRFTQSLQELDPNAMPEDNAALGRIEDYKYSLHRLAEDLGDGTFDMTLLRDLAEQIVTLIRSRDRAFLTLAEFLGPLDPGSPEDGSLIEQAIESVGVNDTAIHRGSPAFMTQADLLHAIAPLLQTRSDTFRIRSYGSAGDTAEAWFEITVQRVVEPIEELPTSPSLAMTEMRQPTGAFGRQFKILNSRFLDSPEQ